MLPNWPPAQKQEGTHDVRIRRHAPAYKTEKMELAKPIQLGNAEGNDPRATYGTVRVYSAIIEGQPVLLKFESPLEHLDDNTCFADWPPLRGTAAAHFVSVTHPTPPYDRNHK